MSTFFEKNFRIILAAICLLLVVQMWLCSGNLAPYASTLGHPHIINHDGNYIFSYDDPKAKGFDCFYIANYDHLHYIANFNMMRGLPAEHWNWAHLLRRPLMFMIGYPFMKLFGFIQGGFIIAVMANIAALVFFCLWVRNRWGTSASLAALLLLGAYPGTLYWGGLPYPHSLLTPCTLLLTVLLFKISETSDTKKIALFSFITGVSFLAYDTYIFFFPAFGLLLLLQKKWKAMIPSLVLMLLPLGLWLWFLHGKTTEGANYNSVSYNIILGSYKEMNMTAFMNNLKALPDILLNTAIGMTYLYIAVFFVIAVIFGFITKSYSRPHVATVAYLGGVLFLFLLTNMAPPYEGWQMRGTWISRIYQPGLLLFLLPAFPLFRKLDMENKAVLRNCLLGTALVVYMLNMRINVSPAFGDYSQSHFHYKFYHHSYTHAVEENLTLYGRRPLGVCN